MRLCGGSNLPSAPDPCTAVVSDDKAETSKVFQFPEDCGPIRAVSGIDPLVSAGTVWDALILVLARGCCRYVESLDIDPQIRV
jgi:hypothetical protein